MSSECKRSKICRTGAQNELWDQLMLGVVGRYAGTRDYGAWPMSFKPEGITHYKNDRFYFGRDIRSSGRLSAAGRLS